MGSPRHSIAAILALLNRPLLGTQVVPRAGRVDPARFPHEEFPTYCPACLYLLRGLPDQGRCPECGKPFDRGDLLVQQYVWNRRVWRLSRVGRWTVRISVAALMLAVLGPVAIVAVNWAGYNIGRVNPGSAFTGLGLGELTACFRVLFWLELIVLACLVGSTTAGAIVAGQHRQKRQRVIDALANSAGKTRPH
jgi:hypothetical protein